MKASFVLAFALSAPAFAQQLIPTAIYYQQSSSFPEQIEWQTVKNCGDLQKLYGFQSRYPKGHYARQVADKIAKLEWTQVDKKDPNAVREFLAQNGNQSYIQREASRLHLNLAPASAGQDETAARLVPVDPERNRGMVVRVSR
jgi:hypothetical protein